MDVQEPVASQALLDQPAELRARAEREGYLFFRSLLPAEPVAALAHAVLAILRDAGWLDPEAPLSEARPRTGFFIAEGMDGYPPVYRRIQGLEPFHALAHHERLVTVFRHLLEEAVLVHPRNIARVIFPQETRYTTPPHQDYIFIQGTPAFWTAWTPLLDCSEEMGGLAWLAGSHELELLPTEAAAGAGGRGVRDIPEDRYQWLATPMQRGDVVVFHSHTVHRGLDNVSDRIRLSVDYRYQPASHPVTQSSLEPHLGVATWEQIYADWPDEASFPRYYWRDLDLEIAAFDHELLAVHNDGPASEGDREKGMMG